MPSHAVGYDEDFYAWTQEQAALLEGRYFDTLDLAHLIEEITSLGISQRLALGSHLRNLLPHFLKWHYQPGMSQTRQSWRRSLTNARHEMDDILDASPSLRRDVPMLVLKQYPKARREAQDETGLSLATFPEACPWATDQVLDAAFFPEA